MKPPGIIADNSVNFGQLGWGHAKSKLLMYLSMHVPLSHDGIIKLKNPETESMNWRKRNSGWASQEDPYYNPQDQLSITARWVAAALFTPTMVTAIAKVQAIIIVAVVAHGVKSERFSWGAKIFFLV